MLALAKWSNLKIYTLRCSIGMKTSTLSLTSPCSGTKRKTTVPLFFASTGGLRLLSFMPILHHSLQLFEFYSPSLRRGSVGTGGLRLLSFMPILHHSLQLFDFYSPSLRRGSVSTDGLRLPPITDLYCIRATFSYWIRFSLVMFLRAYFYALIYCIKILQYLYNHYTNHTNIMLKNRQNPPSAF